VTYDRYSELDRINRVMDEKIKRFKFGNYNKLNPTIDECTEESRGDTSID
jgi:hypothetical protein